MLNQYEVIVSVYTRATLLSGLHHNTDLSIYTHKTHAHTVCAGVARTARAARHVMLMLMLMLMLLMLLLLMLVHTISQCRQCFFDDHM